MAPLPHAIKYPKKVTDVVDPRFTTEAEDKVEADAKPSEKRPSVNSPADIMPYWRAVEDVRNDRMPGSEDMVVASKDGPVEPLPASMFPKYNYDQYAPAKPRARPIKNRNYYEEPLQTPPVSVPSFDKHGRVVDPEEAAASLKKGKAATASGKAGAAASATTAPAAAKGDGKADSVEEQKDSVQPAADDKAPAADSTKADATTPPAAAAPEAAAPKADAAAATAKK